MRPASTETCGIPRTQQLKEANWPAMDGLRILSLELSQVTSGLESVGKKKCTDQEATRDLQYVPRRQRF